MSARHDNRGRLLVVSAPSGAGKTTLVHALLAREPRLRFSTSYTTRPKRPNERPGRDYHFVSEDQFRKLVDEDAFLEHARVFDHWYGTARADVERLLAAGYSVLLEIDWQGARQVRERAPDSISVFIVPPSVGELERRLRARATDSEATIQRRLRDALGDLSHWSEFDYVVENDVLETAVEALAAVVAGRGEEHSTASPAVRARMERLLAG